MEFQDCEAEARTLSARITAALGQPLALMNKSKNRHHREYREPENH
jgi:hypothetical protein